MVDFLTAVLILWGPEIARNREVKEALFLFASYTFDMLGYRRIEWKCHDGSAPSKRFSFTFEGVFRKHMVVKGENRDTAWYSITVEE